MTPTPRTIFLAAVLVGGVSVSTPVAAQFGRIEDSEAPSWAPVAVGVRGGYDNTQREFTLGGQVHIPILPSGAVVVIPNLDVTFLEGLEEYQYNLDVVYVFGERSSGLYVGGGVGLRDSRYGMDTSRSTSFGYDLLFGLKIAQFGRFIPQLEARWNFVDESDVTYRTVSLGASFALWSP